MALAQFLDQVADLDDLQRVQAHGGFVQNDDLGVAQQRLGDAYTLPVTFGQVGNAAVAHSVNAGFLDDFLDLTVQFLAVQALCFAHKSQIFHGGIIQIQGRVFGQIPDLALGFVRVLKDVEPVDAHMAGSGRKAAGHNVHGGGLAGAVGPQKAVYMPFFNFEGDVVDRQEIPVVFAQVLNGDHLAPPCSSFSCVSILSCGFIPPAPLACLGAVSHKSIGAEYQLPVKFCGIRCRFLKTFTICIPVLRRLEVPWTQYISGRGGTGCFASLWQKMTKEPGG